MMKSIEINEDAVSEVVGEMLMIALVLILVAIFSASVNNYLPEERDPSINIMSSANDSHIILYHKGGDWIRSADFDVTVSNGSTLNTYSCSDGTLEVITPSDDFSDSSFALGGRLVLPHVPDGDVEVKMVTKRSVIFSGSVCR